MTSPAGRPGRPPLPARLKGTAAVALRAPAQRRVAFRSPAALERLQSRRVTAAVSYAAARVPYYRETIGRLGLEAGDFRRADDLRRLPVIERSQLQADPEYFVADGSRSGWIELRSGGSTGRPVTVFRDPASVFATTIHAQRLRSLVAGGVGHFRFREVVISAPAGSGATIAGAFRRSSLIPPWVRSERMLLSLFDPPSEQADAIDAFRPDVIGSYGSYLEALFVHMEATGRPRHRPKVVTYAADPMSDSARELITGMGIRVLSAYQAIEAGQVGFECGHGTGLHLNADYCPARIVGPEGADLPEGESGEVVISDLTNRATVLLNYRMGDLAAMAPPCSCGRNLPMLSLLEGRSVEWLSGPAGERIHPQTALAVLRLEPGVRRYQVVQHARAHIEVSVVIAPGADEVAIHRGVQAAMAGQFPPGMRTTVRTVDDLQRTAQGKVRPVISML